MVKTAVVILNWNGSKHKLLRHYLPSVVRYTPEDLAEVVVADNGSDDDSLQLLAEYFPTVRVLPLGQNYGFAEGYNRAINALRKEGVDNVVLLNDDVRVTEGWLEPMLTYMENHRECAALQPKLLKDWSFDEKNPGVWDSLNPAVESKVDSFEYAGACGGFLDNLCYPFCQGRIFDNVEEDHGQYDLPDGQAYDVMWATGACLLVRVDRYLTAGGLDARFFAHMEEIDLCWRLRRLGYSIGCLPQSVVYHKGGASLPQGNPRKTMLNFRNSLVMMWKNLPTEKRDKLIFRRKLLDGLAALNFLLHGQWGNFCAIWKAHREASQMIKTQYKASDLVGFGQAKEFPEESRSILWDYYVRGRKTYYRSK